MKLYAVRGDICGEYLRGVAYVDEEEGHEATWTNDLWRAALYLTKRAAREVAEAERDSSVVQVRVRRGAEGVRTIDEA